MGEPACCWRKGTEDTHEISTHGYLVVTRGGRLRRRPPYRSRTKGYQDHPRPRVIRGGRFHRMAKRRLTYMPLDELPSAEKNPRGHDEKGLESAISRFGFLESLVVDERTGRLIAGHGRRDDLIRRRDAGEPVPDGIVVDKEKRWCAPVVRGWSSKDDDDAHAAGIALNRIGEGLWKTGELVELLDQLGVVEPGLEGLGFGPADLDGLLRQLQAEEFAAKGRPVASDDAPPVPERAVTKPNDLWLMGDHKLLCADSRDPASFVALLGDERADMVWTDPPYGMNLDPTYSDMHKTGGPSRDYESVIGDSEAFDAGPLLLKLADVSEQFWFGADYYRRTIDEAGSWIVWDKRWDAEMEARMDAALGGQFELCWSKRRHRREIARVLWSGHHGMQTEDTKRRLHPTQKPIALVTWFFDRWGKRGDLVLDPFAGSGTLLMACEQEGRRARCIEVDARYSDVIVQRWQAHADRAAVLASSGATFAEVAAEVTSEAV